jgi:hypothetical protein
MNQKPTYEDAELILKLYDLRREQRLRAARAWFAAEFSARTVNEAMEKYPPGSDHKCVFSDGRRLLGYGRFIRCEWNLARGALFRIRRRRTAVHLGKGKGHRLRLARIREESHSVSESRAGGNEIYRLAGAAGAGRLCGDEGVPIEA